MAQILPFAQTPPPESIDTLIALFAFAVILILVFLTPALTALWFRDRIFSRDLRKAKKRFAQRLRELAEQGDPEALYGLAIYNATKGMVLSAQRHTRIENESDWSVHFQLKGDTPLKWTDRLRTELIKAGEMGSIRAKMTLVLHLTESGAPTAGELWRELAEREVPDALVTLGRGYLEGSAVLRTPRDPAIAAQYFERAAARDVAAGEYWLAELYRQGLGVEQDDKRAAQLYERVIAKDQTYYYKAKTKLGAWLLSNGEDAKDRERGAQLLLEVGSIFHNNEPTSALVCEAERDNPYALVSLATLCAREREHKRKISDRPYRQGDVESLLQRAAQLGAVVAMRRLGEFYEERKEWERAEYWYGQALEQNDSSSATQLGKLGALYLTKNYRATRGERAIELLRRASDAGNGEAATALGKLCARGELTPQNNEEAFALFKLGAEQGNVEAMLELGARYASGTGTDIDLREAINWLTRVAFSHDENALKKRYGESALKKLKEIADQYHIASASRAVAVWNLRLGTSVKSRYSEALRRLRLLVERGDARAMALLGDALLLRVAETGLSSGRLKSVANLYRRAAELGDVHGMKALGDCYRLGFGKEIDEVQAATWYQAAAERGDVDAMFELARLYYRGLGVPKDVEKARAYARRARDAGNMDAQEWLDLYEFDASPAPSSLVEEASSNDY